MVIREIRFSQSAILKLLKDIFGAASPVGATSTTSDSTGITVRDPSDTEKLERWDEIVLQYKRMQLHLFLLTGFDGIEQNTIPNKIILRSSPSIVVEVDDDLADLLHVRDVKAETTVGGGFTSGSFQTRDLNTVLTNEISGASLGSNQITLPAGTYEVTNCVAPAHRIQNHKARLQDVTNAVTLILGTNEVSDSTDGSNTSSHVFGRFTLSGTVAVEVQHQCQTTKASDGFGRPNFFGVDEIYTDIMIKKIA